MRLFPSGLSLLVGLLSKTGEETVSVKTWGKEGGVEGSGERREGGREGVREGGRE